MFRLRDGVILDASQPLGLEQSLSLNGLTDDHRLVLIRTNLLEEGYTPKRPTDLFLGPSPGYFLPKQEISLDLGSLGDLRWMIMTLEGFF